MRGSWSRRDDARHTTGGGMFDLLMALLLGLVVGYAAGFKVSERIWSRACARIARLAVAREEWEVRDG